MSRRNIIVLTSTFPRWSNDTDPPFVYELSRRLTKKFDVHVLAPNYPGARQNENLDGMAVHRFRYFFKRFEKLAGSSGILPTIRKNKLYYLLIPFFITAEFIALWKLVRKIKPDVVHAHWLIPQGFVAAIVKKLTGTPFVVTAHGSDVFGLRGNIFRLCKIFSINNADRITVVSSVIKKAASEMSNSIIEPIILPMGVDSTRFSITNKDDSIRRRYDAKGPLLLFVGRLSEVKGIRYLLEAMPAVISKEPETKLLIIGSGEEEDTLKELNTSLELERNVFFVGSIPNSDLPQFYRAADIFVGPSIQAKGGDTEGFGLTFVEAGMSGCVLIGSNVGGIPDIIQDGRTGFLIEEKDTTAIAAKILEIINQREDWPEIRNRTRIELVNNFSLKTIAKEYSDLLSLVCEKSNTIGHPA